MPHQRERTPDDCSVQSSRRTFSDGEHYFISGLKSLNKRAASHYYHFGEPPCPDYVAVQDRCFAGLTSKRLNETHMKTHPKENNTNQLSRQSNHVFYREPERVYPGEVGWPDQKFRHFDGYRQKAELGMVPAGSKSDQKSLVMLGQLSAPEGPRGTPKTRTMFEMQHKKMTGDRIYFTDPITHRYRPSDFCLVSANAGVRHQGHQVRALRRMNQKLHGSKQTWKGQKHCNKVKDSRGIAIDSDDVAPAGNFHDDQHVFQRVRHSATGHLLYNVAGGEDLMPAATLKCMVYENRPSKVYEHQNDFKYLPFFERGGRKPWNPQNLSIGAYTALQPDEKDPGYQCPHKRMKGSAMSECSSAKSFVEDDDAISVCSAPEATIRKSPRTPRMEAGVCAPAVEKAPRSQEDAPRTPDSGRRCKSLCIGVLHKADGHPAWIKKTGIGGATKNWNSLGACGNGGSGLAMGAEAHSPRGSVAQDGTYPSLASSTALKGTPFDPQRIPRGYRTMDVGSSNGGVEGEASPNIGRRSFCSSNLSRRSPRNRFDSSNSVLDLSNVAQESPRKAAAPASGIQSPASGVASARELRFQKWRGRESPHGHAPHASSASLAASSSAPRWRG